MKNRNRLICGVGINDADYVTQKNVRIDGKQKQLWICPYYRRWKDLITRCYSKNYIKFSAYNECYVCDEWLIFSNFRIWMINQDWQGKQLDKDLFIHGNKIYSPENCIFVNGTVNKFTTDSAKSRGEWPVGVHFDKLANKFSAKCSNPFTGKLEHLGLFVCSQEAHNAWKKRKHQLSCELAGSNLVDDERLVEVLKTRYLN